MRRGACCAGMLVVLAACSGRFEFDLPAVAGAGGGSQAGAGGSDQAQAGSPPLGGVGGGAGTSGAGGVAGSGTSGASGASACGAGAACPSHLRCVEGECRECATAGDCSDPARPLCLPDGQRCVGCLASNDCAEGFVCDERTKRCLQGCAGESDCPASAHECDEEHGVCVECDGDHECVDSPLGEHCALDGSSCAACHDSDDCSGGYCDDYTGRCVACRGNDDCASGRCDPTLGVCLE